MKRAAYAAGAAVLLLALAALLAPAYIDRPAVQADIQRRLSEALKGQVTWEALEVALFPAPHGELRKLRIEIPGKLGATADEVEVDLRFWPLLRGRAEISSLTLKKPAIRVLAAGAGGNGDMPPFDAVAAYRAAMEPVANALQEFAPDMAFKLDEASVELRAGFAVRDLTAAARTDRNGVQLELTAASTLWKRLSLEARVEYADLSARAAVALDALALDKDIPPGALRARLRTDGKSAIEGDLEGNVGALVPAAKGKLVAPAGKAPELSAELTGIDLAQALAIARRKVPGLEAIESAQGRVTAKADASLDPSWLLNVEILKSDAAVKLAELPWPLSAHGGKAAITGERVRVTGLNGAVGKSAFSGAALQVELEKPARVSSASGRATLELEQWFPWLQAKLPLEEIASVSGSSELTLSRLALRFDNPAAADFDAVARPHKVSAALKALPAAITMDGGSVRAGPKEATLENVAVAMLDARTRVSGKIGIAKLAVELALAEGFAGEKAVQWALERGGVPERFEPRTPLRFEAKRIAWAPEEALEADARIDFDGGPQVALTLASKPKLLELPRIAIKDASSDAVLGVAVADDLVRASFAGTLQGRSIAAMLRRPGPETASGTVNGKLRLTVDRKQPRRTVAEGRLRAEALDLSWLAGKRALLERVDLTAEPTGARIVDARFDWDEQIINLRGEVKRTAQGPVIDARLESPGVVLDRLLPEPQAAGKGEKDEKSKLWPLPVTGRVEVRSGFVQYKDRTVMPFEGRLSLERERARLEVQKASMCGVSFPMEVEAVPEKVTAAAHISMRNESLEKSIRCLTGGDIEITGNADVRAELRTEGRRPDLFRNMSGTVEAETRKGSVKRFALIGNILSLRNIASATQMKEDGFPYRSITAKGYFQDGNLMLEEGFFDSSAVRLGGHGKIDLLGDQSRLTVLVAPLTNVDRVVGAIPILGDVLGGSLTALPVGVSGDIRDPLVVPLGPRAITDSLLGIFERTLKLPGKLVAPAAEAETPAK